MSRRGNITMTAVQVREHQEKHGFKYEFEKFVGKGMTAQKAVDKLLNPSDGMNKTEREFSRILEAKKQHGELTSYQYEGVRLRWGGSMWYKPDFIARGANGVTYVYEVKGGHIWSRDLVRFKGCREEWKPYRIEFEMWQKKEGQWWQIQ